MTLTDNLIIHIKNCKNNWFKIYFNDNTYKIISIADLISIKASMESKRKTAFILDEVNNKYNKVYINNILKIEQL